MINYSEWNIDMASIKHVKTYNYYMSAKWSLEEDWITVPSNEKLKYQSQSWF
jgi:hypothetical protein